MTDEIEDPQETAGVGVAQIVVGDDMFCRREPDG